MFQSFDDPAGAKPGRERFEAMIAALNEAGVDGFLIPRADSHQGEYVAPCHERLSYLTGFGGSAGMAAILGDKAAIFIDGRYTLQVEHQVETSIYEPLHLIDYGLGRWLSENANEGQRVGFDPWLHTDKGVTALRKTLEDTGADLVAVARNPVDTIWTDRPAEPKKPIIPHPIEYSGASIDEKREILDAALDDAKADACILTDLDSIAWAFNFRGADIAHLPVALSFAILDRENGPTLFIAPEQLTDEARAHFGDTVSLAGPEKFASEITALGERNAQVLIDTSRCAYAIAELLRRTGGTIIDGRDPTALPRARKNDIEIAGARAAHLRDGRAMLHFLSWLDRETAYGSVDEISAAQALERFRAETNHLSDLSFDTISGAGENGAIVHYRVTQSTNRKLETGSLYLVDSGGQYRDGTTDITRTIAIGAPTPEMRKHYTLVLKGHIAVTLARFPKGTTGQQVDVFARQFLWAEGLDYDHGTGHGVGSYLSVHEGPQNLSKRGTVPLEAGMIVSNEPGFYKTGAYGIRIENLLVTVPVDVPGAEREVLGFETLTLAPYDLELIDKRLLTTPEKDWLNEYNADLRKQLSKDLPENVLSFLKRKTAPIS